VNADTLTARENVCGWSVEDSSGQVWWPDSLLQAEIAGSDNPAQTVLWMLQKHPMRGTWTH
jgi:hypothetical protein